MSFRSACTCALRHAPCCLSRSWSMTRRCRTAWVNSVTSWSTRSSAERLAASAAARCSLICSMMNDRCCSSPAERAPEPARSSSAIPASRALSSSATLRCASSAARRASATRATLSCSYALRRSRTFCSRKRNVLTRLPPLGRGRCRELDQCAPGVREIRAILWRLDQERLDRLTHADRSVELRIRALLVGAHRDEILLLPVERHESLYRVRRLALFRIHDLIAHAALALQHLDRRKVAGGREPAAQDHVTVENGARSVCDRLVEVVAFDEYGVDAADAAARAVARALEQPGQRSEDGRRIALGRGRLADRQTDLAPGHRDARDGIDHQHHVFALVAVIFRDRCGQLCAACADERCLI